MEQSTEELRKSILSTIARHPNSKVSKLINCFEVERTPQNIALLLMELAEHAEYSADISLSLKYYLDYFKELAQECSFADAGIVLYNSSIIYGKRVDRIHQEVERLILSLSNVENTDDINTNADAENQSIAPKEKRGRKRALEPMNGPYEVDMNPKRFKKLSNNKRFEDSLAKRNSNINSTFQESRLKDASNNLSKHYIHPATWQHSVIDDFDYEDEVDSKKNYKLFTYHLEHRYNTLISDINFKMYFKMKDYIDGECRDSALPESWPPLSDAYIEQYVNMEDAILTKEGHYERSRIFSEQTAAYRSTGNVNNSINILEHSSSKNTTSGQSLMDSGIGFDMDSDSQITDTQVQSNLTLNDLTEDLTSQTIPLVGDLTKNSDSRVGLDLTEDLASQTNPLVGDLTKNSDSGVGLDLTEDLASQTNPFEGDLTKNSNAGVGLDIKENTTTNEPPAETGVGLAESSEAQSINKTNEASAVGSEHQMETNTESNKIIENDTPMDEEVAKNESTTVNSELENPTNIEKPTENDSTKPMSSDPETPEDKNKLAEKDSTLLEYSTPHDEDLSTLKIRLPHLADEGIFFSELDELDRQMLSPAVVAQDVFHGIKDKSNIVIAVDDAIKQLFQIKEPSDEMFSLPFHAREEFVLPLNILEIPLKYFKKRSRFKLGPEFNLPKQERLKKYVRRYAKTTSSSAAPRKWVRLSEDVTGVHTSPITSPSYEPEWLGFPEEEELAFDKNRTMSRDSGISLPQIDKEASEDFGEASDLLNSALKSSRSELNLVKENLGSNIDLSEGLSEKIEIPAEKKEEATATASDGCPKNNEEATATASDDCPKNNDGAATTASDECPTKNEEATATTAATASDKSVNKNNEATIASDDCREDNEEATFASDDCQRSQLEDLNEETRVRTKVQEWHSHLQPILACSRERHHFDVFALGTEIMSQFDRTDVCYDKVSLKDVMEEKDESLISRYFLSMLLLANQGNISINVQNKSTNEPSELQDIRLKLVSRKRNIVSLEDNIGLAATQTASTRIVEATAQSITRVRTLKRFPEVPKTDDRDSGIAMSEESVA